MFLLLILSLFFFALAEANRPYLSHIENISNSDYINACYVDVSRRSFSSHFPQQFLTNTSKLRIYQRNIPTVII